MTRSKFPINTNFPTSSSLRGASKFQISNKDSKTKARLGKLSTPHGEVLTPTFNPVGTQATVKTLTPHDLKDIGVQMVLANTYHLMLRPGVETVEKIGGLHKFMNWEGPIMTDSGGYQVFSLGVAQEGKEKLTKFTKEYHGYQEYQKYQGEKKEKEILNQVQNDTKEMHSIEEVRMHKTQRINPAVIDDDGVTFYSHLDGSKHRLDPKTSIEMQEKLGADLIVAFDDHESPLWDHAQTQFSLERSNRWGLESLKVHKRTDQLMYGVVHGGLFEDLRIESAQFTDKHFDAISIGGSYSTRERLYKVLEWTVPYFAENKPRHLLGIGEIVDMFEAVERGIDLFDCVAATRRARHGSVYISLKNGGSAKKNSFAMQLTNSAFTLDQNPIDPGCECYTCQHFTRSYLSHLFKADELLGHRLATYHNVYFLTHLMEQMRTAIGEGRFVELKKKWIEL